MLSHYPTHRSSALEVELDVPFFVEAVQSQSVENIVSNNLFEIEMDAMPKHPMKGIFLSTIVM